MNTINYLSYRNLTSETVHFRDYLQMIFSSFPRIKSRYVFKWRNNLQTYRYIYICICIFSSELLNFFRLTFSRGNVVTLFLLRYNENIKRPLRSIVTHIPTLFCKLLLMLRQFARQFQLLLRGPTCFRRERIWPVTNAVLAGDATIIYFIKKMCYIVLDNIFSLSKRTMSLCVT